MTSDKGFLESELKRFRNSPKRLEMLAGMRYHQGHHDILSRNRTCIGRDGKVEVLKNLPNNRLVDNQYARAVEQKADYLVAKPLSFECDDAEYLAYLRKFFNRGFLRLLKSVAKDALSCGVCWMHPYYTEDGVFSVRKFPGYEILPFWRDSAHETLDCALRLYEREVWEGSRCVRREFAELYDRFGITFFEVEQAGLNPVRFAPYLTRAGESFTWERVPLVPFRACEEEIPLIRKVKPLQDALNEIWSDWANGLQSTPYNEILVLKNYDGADLKEFRHNLAAYGAVKVRTVDGTDGGLDRLEVKVDAAGYQCVVRELKRAIVENAMGFDARDVRSGNNPNQMNLRSMYTDMDLDANSMESEFTLAILQLLGFFAAHLAFSGVGEFRAVPVKLTFNRDMLMNEGEIMDSLYQGGLKLSNRTLVGQVPFVDDVAEELSRLEQEENERERKRV